MSTIRERLRSYSYNQYEPDYSDNTGSNNEERSTQSVSRSSSLEDKIQNQIWDKLKNYHIHIFGDYTLLSHKKSDK